MCIRDRRPESHIRMDEYPQAVRLILQDIIRAAAHDHAGAFFRQPGDELVLDLPEIIRIAVAGRRAVSYTHLDVYKRQPHTAVLRHASPRLPQRWHLPADS